MEKMKNNARKNNNNNNNRPYVVIEVSVKTLS